MTKKLQMFANENLKPEKFKGFSFLLENSNMFSSALAQCLSSNLSINSEQH